MCIMSVSGFTIADAIEDGIYLGALEARKKVAGVFERRLPLAYSINAFSTSNTFSV